MTPRAKKSKGNKHETRIAEEIHYTLLSLNPKYKSLFEDLADDNLRPKRDYSSGNFLDSQGDINLGLAKNFFPYSIECKHWKSLDLSLNALLKQNISSLVKVWNEQTVTKAREIGLTPLVVCRGNRTEDFCFYDKEVVKLIPIGRFVKIDNWIICLFKDFINEANRRIVEGERPFNKEG